MIRQLFTAQIADALGVDASTLTDDDVLPYLSLFGKAQQPGGVGEGVVNVVHAHNDASTLLASCCYTRALSCRRVAQLVRVPP